MKDKMIIMTSWNNSIICFEKMVRINFFFTVVSKDSVWVLRHFLGQWNYYYDFWLLSPFWQFSIRNLTFFITDSIGLFEPLNTHRGKKTRIIFIFWNIDVLSREEKTGSGLFWPELQNYSLCSVEKMYYFICIIIAKKYFLFFAWGRDCVKCYSSLCSREGVQYDPIRRSSPPPPPPSTPT